MKSSEIPKPKLAVICIGYNLDTNEILLTERKYPFPGALGFVSEEMSPADTRPKDTLFRGCYDELGTIPKPRHWVKLGSHTIMDEKYVVYFVDKFFGKPFCRDTRELQSVYWANLDGIQITDKMLPYMRVLIPALRGDHIETQNQIGLLRGKRTLH
jgi:hypothetical protein